MSDDRFYNHEFFPPLTFSSRAMRAHDEITFDKLRTPPEPVKVVDPRASADAERLKRLEAMREFLAQHANDEWLSQNGSRMSTREMSQSHLYFALAKAYRGEYPAAEFRGRTDKLEAEALRRLTNRFFFNGVEPKADNQMSQASLEIARHLRAVSQKRVDEQAKKIAAQDATIHDLKRALSSLGFVGYVVDDPVRDRQASFCAATLGRDPQADEQTIFALEQGNRKLADSVRALTSEKAQLEAKNKALEEEVARLARLNDTQKKTIEMAQCRAYINATKLGLKCEGAGHLAGLTPEATRIILR